MSVSYAEDRVGNGGDVLICDETGGRFVYILDEYEQTTPITIGRKDLDYRIKVDLLLNRIKENFPLRYSFYKHNFERFKMKVNFEVASLPEINDAEEWNTDNCYIQQAAYFKQDRDNHYVYFIQKGIWNRLNNDQKAILVLHELLYTEAVGLGHSTSLYVRQVNRLIFSSTSYSAAVFDQAFIIPLRSLPKTAGLVIQQLRNAYSPGVATYLLQYDLSKFYADKKLRNALMTLRERFKNSSDVVNLIDGHLQEMEIPLPH